MFNRYLFSNDDKYPHCPQIEDNLWRVERPFVATVKDDNDKWVQVLIPIGLETDYRSGSDWLDGLISKMGPYSAVWLTHDVSYSGELFKRSTSDWNMLCGLKDAGAWWFNRNIAWANVRIWGSRVWDKHTNESIELTRSLIDTTKKILSVPDNPYQIIYNDGLYRHV